MRRVEDQEDIRRATERLVSYVLTLYLVGPLAGALVGLVFWGVVNVMVGYPATFPQCWAVAWLVVTALYCADIRQRGVLKLTALGEPEEKPQYSIPGPSHWN